MSYPSNIDKDSLYLLQCLDSNCNDCKWMSRDIEKFKVAQERRKQGMIDHFNTVNQKEKETALEKLNRGKITTQEYKSRIREIDSRQYVHTTPHPQIQYGRCTHPVHGGKEVSFLPTTFMEETQHCFEHRKS